MDIPLDFKGPFHYDHLKVLPDINQPGIYIWGFVYNYDKNGLIDTVNFSSGETPIPEGNINGCDFNVKPWKFIPHYVGIASGKSNFVVKRRLEMHHSVQKGDARKYKRFTTDYMKKFFKGESESFYNNYLRKHNELLIKDNFTYFNNSEILKRLYPNDIITDGNKNHYPIERQKVKSTNTQPLDTLANIVNNNENSKNNFWFFYAVPSFTTLQTENDRKKILEYLEAFVFYSLKGMTISHTKSLKTLNNWINQGNRVKIEGNLSLFEVASKMFTGDY